MIYSNSEKTENTRRPFEEIVKRRERFCCLYVYIKTCESVGNGPRPFREGKDILYQEAETASGPFPTEGSEIKVWRKFEMWRMAERTLVLYVNKRACESVGKGS